MLRYTSHCCRATHVSHSIKKPSFAKFNFAKRQYSTAETRFTKDHEWVKFEGDVATVGITDYAQEQLGDVVFVDLPTQGQEISKGDTMAVVESVKAASDIYSPISGEVVESNNNLSDNPALVNSDPITEGWIAKVKVKDVAAYESELLNKEAYDNLVEESG